MSLYVLDTDVLSLHRLGHPKVRQHVRQHPPSDLAATVLTVEEQLAGWFTRLRRAKDRSQLAVAYQRLTDTVAHLGQFQLLTFTEPAILRYEGLLAQKLGVGKMDLRIAAVVLENAAVLVSRNLRDFSRVPGLTVVDWSV